MVLRRMDKVVSLATVAFMVTAGFVIVFPLSIPVVAAYDTPDTGVVWTFDDLVANSNGSVIGGSGVYFVIESITVMQNDTLVLVGGEDVLFLSGSGLEVYGAFDGNGGGYFHSLGGAGEWQGISIYNGSFNASGLTILDAANALYVETNVVNINGCNIGNCAGSAITVINSTNVNIAGVNITDCAGSAITVLNSTTANIGGVILTNCTGSAITVEGSTNAIIGPASITNCSGTGISVVNCTDATIDSPTINGCGTGVSFTSSNGTVSGAIITYATDGITATDGNVDVTGDIINNCTGTAVNFFNITSGSIEGLDITDCNLAVYVELSPITVSGNTIYGNQGGVFATNTVGIKKDKLKIQGNEIYNNGGPGVEVTNCINVDVSGNDIYGNGGAGVSISNSEGANVNGNTIYGNGGGIQLSNVNGAKVDGNNVYDNGGTAVEFSNTHGEILNNQIFGRSAAPDGKSPGEDAIVLSGTVSGSTVISGNTIVGGDGGYCDLNDNNAGNGGMGIFVDPLPDVGIPATDNHSIRIVSNTQILGGNGGPGLSADDVGSGFGGEGIHVIDDNSVGSLSISGNTEIRGGNGGNNTATDTGGGTWVVGDGGDGISIVECNTGTTSLVISNPVVNGGNGGNTSGSGSGQAGIGGNGLGLYGTSDITIDVSVFNGGNGGEVSTGSLVAGDGGNAIHLEPSTGLTSSAMIVNCRAYGGNGGQALPGATWWIAGSGGSGLHADGGSLTSGGSFYYGGVGGNSFMNLVTGGIGGLGVCVLGGGNASLTGPGLIFGGTGGECLSLSGFSGEGGPGILAEGVSTVLTVTGYWIITGGNGGVNNAVGGTAGNGVMAISGQNAEFVSVTGTFDISSGAGGYDSQTSTYGSQGDYCIMMVTISSGAVISGNVIHDSDFYGIYYSNTGGVISDNEIYNIWFSDPVPQDSGTGIYCTNSNPLIELNYIHDNDHSGIMCSNSNPEIKRNTIANTDHYGTYMTLGSSPVIENCTISNSGSVDFYATGNSHPVSLNTTSSQTAGFGDGISTLTMQWFMHVKVVYQNYAPVDNAEVWVNDSYDTNLMNGFTPASGWIKWTIVTEYIEDLGSKTYYTRHEAAAVKAGEQGFYLPIMDKTKIVIIVLGEGGMEMTMNLGWNLMSLPLLQNDESLDVALDTIAGQWDCIQVYDTQDPDHWKTNSTFRPDQANDLDSLDHTIGFWIHITDPMAMLETRGLISTSTSIPLFAGWNLVGYPTFTEETISNALAGTGFDGVEGFDPAAPYRLVGMAGSDIMQPGEAYWVHVPANTFWVVDW